MRDIYSAKHYQQLLLGVILVLGLFILYELRSLISSILGAVVMYTLFKPVYLRMMRQFRIRSTLSALLVILISFLIIVIPFIAVSWMVINKINEFRTQGFLFHGFLLRINEIAGREINDPEFLQHKIADVQTWVFGLFSDALNSFLKSIFTIIIMYFILFFMLLNHEIFESTISKYIPFKQTSTTILGKELRNITHSNIFGQGVIAIVQALCVMAAFAVFGIDDPVFWGVIAGFLSFIPVLGVPSIFIGAAVVSFVMGNKFAGFGMILWGIIVIAVIENYMRIYLGRRIADAHPLITVIGVIIGLPTFGIIGIVFGPLLLSYFVMLVEIYERKYLSLPAKKDT